MAKKRWGALCLGLLLILTSLMGCKGSSWTLSSVVGGATAERPSLSVLGSGDPGALTGLDIATLWEQTETYVLNASYPTTGVEAIDATLRAMAEQAVAAFKEEVSALPVPEPDGNTRIPYEFNLSYRVYRHSQALVSFKFESMTDILPDAPKVEVRTRTFDLERGIELQLSQLFQDTGAYLGTLSQLCREQLGQCDLPQDAVNQSLLLRGTAALPENYARFALGQEGLILFFPAGQVAPKDYGDWQVVLPYDHLGDAFLPGPAEPLPITQAQPVTAAGQPTAEAPAAEPTARKRIALTFDDGPHVRQTPKLLDVLAAYGAHATFFVLGNRADHEGELLNRMVAEGHQIGTHTYTHKQLSILSNAQITEELEASCQTIERLTGVRPTALRPPYGSKNASVLQIATQERLSIILWNVDPEDWKCQNANQVASHIIQRAQDGDIILLHDMYGSTVDAVERVLSTLTGQGYEFVTVDELIPNSQPGEVYYHEDSRPQLVDHMDD